MRKPKRPPAPAPSVITSAKSAMAGSAVLHAMAQIKPVDAGQATINVTFIVPTIFIKTKICEPSAQ